MHPIYDTLTLLAICGFAIDIAGIVFSTSFFATGTIRTRIGKIGKTCVRVLSIGEALEKDELISYTANSAIESAFEKTNLAWAYNFVSLYFVLITGYNLVVAIHYGLFQICKNSQTV